MKVRSSYIKVRNARNDISKPNEDYIISNDKEGIYIVADGVTRPHEEYQGNIETSLAYSAAKKVSNAIYECLLEQKTKINEMNIEDILKQVIIKGNEELDMSEEFKTLYKPATALLLIYFFKEKMYFYNSCDTIGLVLRNGRKIQFTERFNYNVKKQNNYSKLEVQSLLYNNIEHKDGYGMLNGDHRFEKFINISHIQLVRGDRIVLSTDGMYESLIGTPARILATMNIDEIYQNSINYDCEPFNKYADDKACILIEIVEI